MRLLREGTMLRDTYEVDRFLGAGAFGEVYRVKHRFLGRQAMKVIKTPGMTLEEAHRMLGEAIILSRVGHPNIVRVFDAGLVDTPQGACAYFTMEYVAGGTLEDFWKSHGAAFVPVETSVEILRQACRGLAVAHAEKPPIVHRDIKPQNILVGYDASGLRVRISDFGLARSVDPLTLLASARGTRRFKGPEVFLDPMSDSCAGDIWGLGCTLYLLLCDRLPYDEVPDHEVQAGRFTAHRLAPPSRFNHRVDDRLDAIVMRALAPKPAQRYATAERMLVDLQAWQAPAPAKAAPLAGEGSLLSKDAFGAVPLHDDSGALKRAERAIALARLPGKLSEAADLMEEALAHAPGLRERYEYQVRLWRKGVVM
ncbi:MAG: serine/threonine protein kinase [Rubrivivax sp.]|nr:serine/threonine protein kinase [Rubrivivax sp.]